LKQKKLEWIESARGLAALAVVLYHCGNMMLLPQYSGALGLNGLFRFGYLGVDFFFVLSGFIIYLVNVNSLGNVGDLSKYTLRRLARILPAYWVTLAVGLLLNQVIQREKVSITAEYLFTEIFLFRSGDLFVGPAWTLQNELIFYAVFSLFFIGVKTGLFGLVAWTALLFANQLNLISFGTEIDAFASKLGPPYIFHFLTGILVSFWYTKKMPLLPLAASLLAAFCCTFFLGAEFLPLWSIKFLNSALAFGAALAVLLIAESFSVPSLPFLVWLGKISYSLYLVHIFLIGYLFALLARLNLYKQIPESILFLLSVVVCCAASWVCFYLVEKPMVTLAQKVTSSNKRTALQPSI
jgi:exopolysaccharide production protein ExoZ